MKIVGIYLAAGQSSRMGENKLALPIGTQTLGSLGIQTALQCDLDKIYIITNKVYGMDWLPSQVLLNEKCEVLKCASSANGQSNSLRSGVELALRDQADAVLVLLGDQPFITRELINGLVTCYTENPESKFIATTLDDQVLPPVLFASTLFPTLLKLKGDAGARSILKGDFLRFGKLVPCMDRRLVFDVDTKIDYEQIQSFRKIES